jgi:AcrR family transcriptional regulator
MDAVAAEAGVSKQTVYRYYRSKDRLFVDVLSGLTYERIRGMVADRPPPAPRTRAELETTLVAIARRSVDIVLDPTYVALFRVAVAEVGEFPELAGLFRSAVVERGAAVLGGLLTSPQLADLVVVEEVAPTLRLLVGPLLSYLLEALLGDPEGARSNARAEVEPMVRLFVKAIARPPE